MYHSVKIEKLSPAQKSRLVNGHGVRVRYNPSGPHEVHLNVQQIKKLQKAAKLNRGITVTMDPTQGLNHKKTGIHGFGIFGQKFDKYVERKLGKAKKDKIYAGINKFGKPIAKGVMEVAAGVAKVYGVPAPVVMAIKKVGNDYIDDPGKFQNMKGRELLENLGESAVKGAVGMGIRFHPPVKKTVKRKKSTKRKRGGALYPAGGALYPAGMRI